MKIAISSTTQNIEDKIDETFGRCQYFIIAEVDNGKIIKTEAIKNENVDQATGAGISSVQLIAKQKVEAVVTGNVGPRAFDVLNQFEIKIYEGKGTVKEAIQDFIDNKLNLIKK
ncbi:MAG: NifB/NifX family molybdenum-iron cluster-binding protein [Candidatus Pacebacteria bacterium]|nr:NifB/NifX family molybdenum-iron cluster-binding protein [Candidatus Paceibacterota bacterium]